VFGFLKRKSTIFTEEEKKQIAEAIRKAEQRTSGEIRVYAENRCSYMDAMDRAIEIFAQLKMDQTKDRNAVLLYIAVKDHQLAVLGDEGIHRKVGNEYWQKEVLLMIQEFNRENYAEGVIECVKDIGEALHLHFPYDSKIDKNELPDDIVFGR
jgi:uncharacterized membrane protein